MKKALSTLFVVLLFLVLSGMNGGQMAAKDPGDIGIGSVGAFQATDLEI